MPRTVASQFADIIAAAGTKRAYDIVDNSLNGLRDATRRRGNIGSLHVPHEEVAAWRRAVTQ